MRPWQWVAVVVLPAGVCSGLVAHQINASLPWNIVLTCAIFAAWVLAVAAVIGTRDRLRG